jgi:hypothetical protein
MGERNGEGKMKTNHEAVNKDDMIVSLERSWLYWQKRAKTLEEESCYYQQQLVDAHALIGRMVHQLSERWDSVNLTKYYPTDNLHHRRTLDNPTGKEK